MSDSPSHPPSIWLISHIKLKFFSRIKGFLHPKAARKRFRPCDHQLNEKSPKEVNTEAGQVMGRGGEDDSLVLQRSVKRLHFGRWDEKEKAAIDIEKLARDNVKMRKLMAELGVIPPLVRMVASEDVPRQQVATKALRELANGSYTNKALMLEAGILLKLPKNIDVVDGSTKRLLAELVLSLSSLAHVQLPLPLAEFSPFLIGILECGSSAVETKEPCLGTLYNLSTVLEKTGALVSSGVVQILLRHSSFKELSEKALATLGNLVVTLMGKRAMEKSELVPECLIEILTWEDKPKCQELSAYILMILAHQSSAQRDKMAKAGIVPVLLEVALLGSSLAQKRALKLLQWFQDERQAKMGPHSGPQRARISMGSPVSQREAQEGKKMMKNLVKQSLHKNLELIARRANTSGDSKLKALVLSTSSKSLPY